MFRHMALLLVISAAFSADASAHLFHHHHHAYSYGYAVPAYGYVAPAPVAYYTPPLYPVPVYPAPAYGVPLVQPVFGHWPGATTIRYKSNPRRSVYRIRNW